MRNIIISSFFLAAFLLVPQVVYAVPYGAGSYGLGRYGNISSSPTPLPHLNLLQNASFELDVDRNNSPDSWWLRATIASDTTTSRTGQTSMKIIGSNGYQYSFQSTNVEPNKTYTMIAWVKTNALNSRGIQLRYPFYIPAGYHNESLWFKNVSDWTQIRRVFTTPSNFEKGRIDINWQLAIGETAWVDDISLCEGNVESCN